MKSMDKLADAMNILNKNANIEDAERCKTLIRQFLMDNTQRAKGRFSCAMFVAKDPLRPAMMCVYHDNENKVAVATDAHALYYSEDEYQYTEGDGLRNAYGDDPDPDAVIYKAKNPRDNKYLRDVQGGRFPNWKNVWPKDRPDDPLADVPICEDLAELVTGCKAAMKLKKHKFGSVRVTNSIWMDVKFADYIVQAGTDGWRCQESGLMAGNRAIFKEWDGQGLLLMPLMAGFDDEDEKRGYATHEWRK